MKMKCARFLKWPHIRCMFSLTAAIRLALQTHIRIRLWVTIVAGLVLFIYMFLGHEEVARRMYLGNDVTRADGQIEAAPPADVFINGYMRSGSSILGKLLGHRDDTFFWYEPLNKQIRWQYLRGKSLLCNLTDPTCMKLKRTIDFDEIMWGRLCGQHTVVLYYSGVSVSTNNTNQLDASLRMLSDIYNCAFQSYWDKVIDVMHPRPNFGGPSWQTYLDCRRSSQQNTQAYCLRKMIHICRNHRHRVIKDVRHSLDNLAPLLESNRQLNIVQLFRDPRGVINSHFRTPWFPVSNGSSMRVIRDDARALCDRMLYDIEAGKSLMKQYPDRIKLFLYEELEEMRAVENILDLYEFLGMSPSEKDIKFIENLTGTCNSTRKNKISGNHPFLYRTALNWTVVQIIDGQCRRVYDALGYVKFCSEKDFRDMNISALTRHVHFK